MRITPGLVTLFALASSVSAQSEQLRFDVTAIKRLGPGGAPVPGVGDVILPGGAFRDPGTTLRNLIETAYDFHDLGLKIVGLPKWGEDTIWIINAKAGPDYPAVISPNQNRENVKAMLRSLLADRFQLKIHQEQRPTKVLVLQVKKGGAKLTEVPAPVPPEKEGYPSIDYRRGRLVGKKVSVGHFVTDMTLLLKQRVEDKTGLTGFYDFDEKWEVPRREGDPAPTRAPSEEELAQLFSALDQNLGLVLKPETLPADFWVVDHVEIPGEN